MSKINLNISKRKAFLYIILFISALFYASTLINSYRKISNSDERLNIAIERKEALENKKTELLNELSVVESDEFKEFQARDKLGLVKQGEYVVILPDEAILRRLSPRKIEAEQIELPKENWRLWSEVLFGV